MNNNVFWGLAALALLIALPVQAGAECTNHQVRLIIKKNELKLTPTVAKCVLANGGFDIIIVPPAAGDGHTVSVKNKDTSDPVTITGNNDEDPGVVAVSVTETGTSDPDVDYGYIVIVEGHGVLDPEVRVVGSRMFMMTTLGEANSVLEEEMGFGVLELMEMQAEYERRLKQAD